MFHSYLCVIVLQYATSLIFVFFGSAQSLGSLDPEGARTHAVDECQGPFRSSLIRFSLLQRAAKNKERRLDKAPNQEV